MFAALGHGLFLLGHSFDNQPVELAADVCLCAYYTLSGLHAAGTGYAIQSRHVDRVLRKASQRKTGNRPTQALRLCAVVCVALLSLVHGPFAIQSLWCKPAT